MQIKMFNNPTEMPLQGWSDDEKAKCAANAAQAVTLYGDIGQKGSPECLEAMLDHAEALRLAKKYDDAITKAEEAQMAFQDKGDMAGQSKAFKIIGEAYTGKGSHDAAIES